MKPSHSDKSILARGCDPTMSAHAARVIPPLVGNPEYVPTTTDDEFFAQLKQRKWDVIYFAPGACRYNAARRPLPGANTATRSWSLDDYRKIVFETQGPHVQIVEALDESETVTRLQKALRLSESPELSGSTAPSIRSERKRELSDRS